MVRAIKPIYLPAVLLIMGTMLLPGCREEEQGRLLGYMPGVYQGKPDQALSDKALAAIRERGQNQAGAFTRGNVAANPNAKSSLPISTLPPATSTGSDALSRRTRRQAF